MKKQGVLNIVLLITLVAFIGVSVYKVEQNNKDIAQSQIQIDELNTTIGKQSKELEDKNVEISNLKNEIKTAQAAIQQLSEANPSAQTNMEVDGTQSNTITYNPF